MTHWGWQIIKYYMPSERNISLLYASSFLIATCTYLLVNVVEVLDGRKHCQLSSKTEPLFIDVFTIHIKNELRVIPCYSLPGITNTWMGKMLSQWFFYAVSF